MTRDEAIAEVERKRLTEPDATWIATQRRDTWVVARIGVAPSHHEPTGTAIKPPPETRQEAPLSQSERATTQFGGA